MPKSTEIPEWISSVLDSLNVEDFISYVELEPVIWDSSKPEYSNNVETEKSWRDVCTKVDPEFESRPATEKNKLGKSLHRRWKSLRDCYTRELKKQKASKSGAAASVRKPYIYFKHLSFLEPVQCITESNVQMEEGEPELLDGKDDQVTDSFLQPQYPQPSRSKKRKDDDDQLMDVLKKKMAIRSNNNKPTDDPDSMFLLSLVPELIQIPENYKLYVKSQIINTILGAQNALNIASMPVSSGPPPQYHNNMPLTQFYPQYSAPNYEIPQTSNYNQASNQLINFYQPNSTTTHPTYHNVEHAAQTKHITPIDSQLSPKIISATTTPLQNISPFSTEFSVTEMSNDSEDFPFWKKGQK